MRVISGKSRGTKLITPEGLNTRPTTDRIKETLFNMIQADIPNSRFLDCFSGSGAIGIEALSRHGQNCTFIEKDIKAIECIENNLSKTGLMNEAKILKTDILHALELLTKENQKFDIIFMDPPYQLDMTEEILKKINLGKILADDGIIIIESSSENGEIDYQGFYKYKEKKYKTTTLTFLCE